MAQKYRARVYEFWNGTGTGDITLAGAPSTEWQTFVQAGYVNGETTDVIIYGAGGFESCSVTYNSGPNSLTRGTIKESSNGGARVDFLTGVKTVLVVIPAKRVEAVFGNLTELFKVVGPTALRSYTFPDADGTVMTLGDTQSVTGAKTFANSGALRMLGSSTGVTLFASANAGASNFTLTFPAATDTVAALAQTQSWSGANTFANNGGARILGSSTGVTLFASANAGGSNFTVTFPAATDTLVGKATTDTLTNKTFDTAGAGNSLSINGVAATANTGTGAVARAAGPTFTTPTLGVASATSINKVAITAPATSATLTIPDGVTMTGPAASGTVMTLGNTEAVSGAKTFATGGALRLGGSSSGVTLFSSANAGASNFTLTFPAATDTVVGRDTTDTLTNKTLTNAVVGTQSPGNNTTLAASTAFVQAAVVAGASGVASIAGNTGAFTLGHGVTNATNEIQADASFFPNLVGGLTLSNDVGTPNTVLDIAAGAATDATNATIMKIGAFTKSVSGAWASGSGSNGMGNGLTIANSTWYHVFLANNSGTPDIYFDTSVSGANRPAGIADTKVRRIGSFRTDGAAHILAFTQVGGTFLFAAPIVDATAAAVPTSATLYAITVPGGVKVDALFRIAFLAGASSSNTILIQSPDETSAVAGGTAGNADLAAVNGATAINTQGKVSVRTNTSGQFRWSASGASGTAYIATIGWYDYRGQI